MLPDVYFQRHRQNLAKVFYEALFPSIEVTYFFNDLKV